MNVSQAVKKYKMDPISEGVKSAYIKRFACDDVHYILETKKQMYYIFSNRNHSMRDDTKMIVMDALGIEIRELWGMLHGKNN